MQIEFSAGSVDSLSGEAAAVLAWEGELWSEELRTADEKMAGAITRTLKTARFAATPGEVLEWLVPAGLGVDRLLLIGAGDPKQERLLAIEAAAARALMAIHTSGAKTLQILLNEAGAAEAAQAAYGALLAAYRFGRYRTKEKVKAKPSVATVRILTRDPQAARNEYAKLAPVAAAVYFARDLVSEPPNVLFPAEFARRVKELETMGLEVEVLGEAAMTELKMGALLSVGYGSRRESQLVVIRWNGGVADAAPVAFVGKGVCFDTGGITLKAGKGMESMKWDMAGAAAVAGVMHALAGRKARVNAVGILGLVENMPDGNAQRPSDVLTTMSGQTIEILSTDAEGRVLLADALWYCQDRYRPRAMIDVATLTGASQTALGVEYSALFSNDVQLAEGLLAAGQAEGELLWQLPLSKRLEKQLESPIADMKNLPDPAGGAISAALFLKRFTNNTTWAHLDITPTTWMSPSLVATVPDGASGYGVRLLNRWVGDHCES
jgi:leucyl aminopeptidase